MKRQHKAALAPMALAVVLAWTVPGAWASEPGQGAAAEETVYRGDYAIVGVGLGSLPRYEGSADNRILPVPGAIGSLGGVGFRLRGPALTLDLIEDAPGARPTFNLGPTLRWRSGRTGKLGDPVVESLGKLKGGLEAGVSASVGLRRILTGHDRLSLGASARWDVAGHGGGVIVTPSVNYLVPVSRAQVVGLMAEADIVDGKSARYAYSVSPAGSAASGLPVYRGRGGLKEAGIGLFTARDLSGNLLDGGLIVGVGAMYSRLMGSAAKTPITARRGKRDQFVGGLAIAYGF